MAFFITVIIGGLAQILIFLLRWPITVIIILRRGFGCVDSSCQSRILIPRATGTAIATIFISPIFLVVLARLFWGFRLLKRMKRHGLCLLKVERKRISVLRVFFGRFWGGAMAPRTISIYLTDPQKKVQGRLGLCRDNFLDGLVPGVFPMIFLLGLSANGWF